jgi:hypothetical protein
LAVKSTLDAKVKLCYTIGIERNDDTPWRLTMDTDTAALNATIADLNTGIARIRRFGKVNHKTEADVSVRVELLVAIDAFTATGADIGDAMRANQAQDRAWIATETVARRKNAMKVRVQARTNLMYGNGIAE